MTREDRYAQAKSMYDIGLLNVKNSNQPKEQKYKNGSFVKIARNLGSSMLHFESDVYAKIEYTYAHAYGGSGQNWKDYSLLVRYNSEEWCSTAWYHENQLKPVTNKKTIIMLQNEVDKVVEI